PENDKKINLDDNKINLSEQNNGTGVEPLAKSVMRAVEGSNLSESTTYTANDANEADKELYSEIPDHYAEDVAEAIAQLLTHFKSYNPGADETKIYRAVDFAIASHKEQKRATGEPYIIHPLAVADILTELEVDEATIIAALL